MYHITSVQVTFILFNTDTNQPLSACQALKILQYIFFFHKCELRQHDDVACQSLDTLLLVMETWDDDCDDDDIYNSGRFIILLLTVEGESFSILLVLLIVYGKFLWFSKQELEQYFHEIHKNSEIFLSKIIILYMNAEYTTTVSGLVLHGGATAGVVIAILQSRPFHLDNC